MRDSPLPRLAFNRLSTSKHERIFESKVLEKQRKDSIILRVYQLEKIRFNNLCHPT